MSWITGLADKAENILNKIDQNAATALQIPANSDGEAPTNVPNSLDIMRKSLSNSTLSLKSTLSPVKVNRRSRTNASSVKSESAVGVDGRMTDSVGSKEKLEWHIQPDTISSRRSSISSKADSVAIDMIGTVVDQQQTKPSYTATGATAQLSTSTTTPENKELAAFKIALNEVTSERDELRLRLSALNRDIENAGLKQRAQELEMLVYRLTEERDKAQHDFHESQSASNAYVHSISELETNLAKLQQEFYEVAKKLQMQMRETEQQRQELQDYRTKAQRALQLKDNLIAELKTGADSDVSNIATDGNTNIRMLQIEFAALKEEHQQKQMENQNLMSQLDEAHRDLHALHKQHAEQLNSLRKNEETLRRELHAERERNFGVTSEQSLLAQELQTVRQQLSDHMTASVERQKEKDEQLQKLRVEKMNNKMSQSDEQRISEYETRIKTLTQTLVDKQNAVESITAERSALRIQLEKLQDQLQQSIYKNSSNSKTPRNALLSNSTDDVKAQFPLLLRENPFDNRVARRVKRAYSSLDSAGIRLGAFLRRYPLMRIFVLMYVALLHIWVMFVLLSSTPN